MTLKAWRVPSRHRRLKQKAKINKPTRSCNEWRSLRLFDSDLCAQSGGSFGLGPHRRSRDPTCDRQTTEVAWAGIYFMFPASFRGGERAAKKPVYSWCAE